MPTELHQLSKPLQNNSIVWQIGNPIFIDKKLYLHLRSISITPSQSLIRKLGHESFVSMRNDDNFNSNRFTIALRHHKGTQKKKR